jgi:hypothetical protein
MSSSDDRCRADFASSLPATAACREKKEKGGMKTAMHTSEQYTKQQQERAHEQQLQQQGNHFD